MKEADNNELYDELGSAFCRTFVGCPSWVYHSQISFIVLSSLHPIVSVDCKFQNGWCALKSPRIRVSNGVKFQI